MKRFFRYLKIVLLALLIIVALFLAYTDLPIKNNLKFFAVTSGSMAPEIPTGSIVIVKPGESIKVNDIISFYLLTSDINHKAQVATHRVIAINQSNSIVSFQTKGDANNTPDSDAVSQSQVIGTVQNHIPYLGYILAIIRSTVGMIIIFVLAVIIIYEELKKIYREIGKMKTKE